MNNMNNGMMPLMPMSPSMGNAQMMPAMNNNMMNNNMPNNNMMNNNMNGGQPQQGGGSIVDSLFAPQLTGSSTGGSIREVQQQSDQYYESPKSPRKHRQYDGDKDEIRKLARNVNKSLDDFQTSKIHTDEEKTEEEIEFDEKTDKKKNEDDYSILGIGKEMILIVIIYVILSQGFVRRSIANYIPQLNPNADGVIPFTGYVIYGSILATIFVFFRYFVVK